MAISEKGRLGKFQSSFLALLPTSINRVPSGSHPGRPGYLYISPNVHGFVECKSPNWINDVRHIAQICGAMWDENASHIPLLTQVKHTHEAFSNHSVHSLKK